MRKQFIPEESFDTFLESQVNSKLEYVRKRKYVTRRKTISCEEDRILLPREWVQIWPDCEFIWASKIIEVDGGCMAFESCEEWRTWDNQV